MAVSLDVTLDAVRQAARIIVGGFPAGADTFTVTRTSPSGSTVGVRGYVGAAVPAGGASAALRDYEVPFGVDLHYDVTVYDGTSTVGMAEDTFRIDYADCEAWLVDLARPTNSLPLLIESMNELEFDAAAGVHRILNRRAPVLTTLPAWTPGSELIVLTDTLGERDQVRALLGSGYPFLLRTDPAQGVGNMYLGVTDFVEERFLTLGAAAQRRFRSAVVQVERPDPAIYVPAPPSDYGEVKAAYATYGDLLAGAVTYDGVLYGAPSEADPVVPWLPDDV